jgi:hypothetical protein
MQQANGFFLVFGRKGGLVIRANPAACNKVNSQECQETSSHKLRCTRGRHGLEVPVEDRTANDDGQSKKDELGRDHLSGVETLQSSVYVADLHQGAGYKDKDEQIRYGESNDMPECER